MGERPRASLSEGVLRSPGSRNQIISFCRSAIFPRNESRLLVAIGRWRRFWSRAWLGLAVGVTASSSRT